MLGGDLIQPDLLDHRPAPGWALVCPLADDAKGECLVGVSVRLVNDDGVTVTHHLDVVSAPRDMSALSGWASVIVVLASHSGGIPTAIDVGRISGWIPVAVSAESDYDVTGYAIGVGISTT